MSGIKNKEKYLRIQTKLFKDMQNSDREPVFALIGRACFINIKYGYGQAKRFS
jgi:hypothetical protein